MFLFCICKIALEKEITAMYQIHINTFIFLLYIKKTVSPCTHSAKWNHSYYMHQYKLRGSHLENTTTTHPAPQAQCR